MLYLVVPVAFLSALLPQGPRLTPVHDPVHAHATRVASEIQIYRLTLMGLDAASPAQTLELVLNWDMSTLKGFIISTTSSVTLDSVTVEGETLRASVPTDHGRAELILLGTSGELHGTFTVSGKILTVSGTRVL